MIRRCVLALVACLVATSQGPAGEFPHRVRSGESVSGLAKRYYGDLDLSHLLLRYNRMDGTTIRVGQALRIPYCDIHTVESGDSWSALAQRYLSQPSAYPAIARLNGLPPDRPLSIGAEIVMPVVYEHVLSPGESLAMLARRSYGDPQLAGLLRSFNGIEDPRRLSVGTTVRIPLLTPRVVEPVEAARSPEPGSAASAEMPESEPGTPLPDLSAELRQARRAFAAGEFSDSRVILESVRGEIERRGSDTERSELSLLVSFVHVAFDETDEACSAIGAAGSGATARLDPDLVSPKIRKVLESCSAAR